MEGESRVTRGIFDELHSSDIHGDEVEGEGGLTQGFIDKLLCWDIQGEKLKVKVVVLKVSWMNFFLQIPNEIKRKLKVVLLEV